MCGLYGVIGSGILQADLKVFHTLAFLNQLRGKHSTGVARVWKEGHGANKKYRWEIKKDTLNAQDFYDKPENEKVLQECLPVAIMGHNRWATVGNKDDINGAHPFENDRFIGFHNGTLKDKQFTDDRKFLTDSESLYDALANSDNPKKILEELDEDSAFALAYFDKKKGRVGFVRNKHRTLAFACHNDRRIVYYSSDVDDLKYALNRMNISYNPHGLSPWVSIETQPDDIQFEVTGTGKDRKQTNLWFLTDLKPNPPKKEPVKHTHFRHDRYSRHWDALRCRGCSDEIHYANSTNNLDPKDDPQYIPQLGLICRDCYNMWCDPIETHSNSNEVTVN